MRTPVTVINYGIGNLKSVSRACEEVGGIVELTGDPARVAAADRLVLPGVGAFPKCMAELHIRGLATAINTFMETQRPFLGICVGAQMMLDSSDEFGHHNGFGFIPGRVEAIPRAQAGAAYKIPHVGWSALQHPDNIDWTDTTLRDICAGEPFYFTHSFAMQPNDAAATLARCSYFQYQFAAVIHMNHHYGCQFHPEKSGRAGLVFLENFLSI